MREKEFNQTIGEIVAKNYNAATVFHEAGIDFCCGGKKTLAEACAEKGVDPEKLAEDISKSESSSKGVNLKYNEWEPSFLCDYITNVHHTFVRKNIPDLLQYTEKIAHVHREHHPELSEVADLFRKVSEELLPHLKKEEEVLFPAIKRMSAEGKQDVKVTVRTELNSLTAEHESAGSAMDRINEITGNYKVPEDACNTYRITLDLLEKFEDDLHTHVHLENNILFPKSLKILNQ
jgi:regulator of cell morphogenesis and NO signaling